MFVNYWRDETRDSGLNLAFARVALCVYAIWKLVSYDWGSLATWPRFVVDQSPKAQFVPWHGLLSYVWVEVGVAVVLLLAVLVGYRLGVTAFASAVVIAYLSGVYYTVTNPSSTFLPIVYLLLFMALFRHTDVISADAIRRTKHRSLQDLHAFLKGRRPDRYSLPAMKWLLVTVGLVYFCTGFTKTQDGLLNWATGANLARIIHMEGFLTLRGVPLLGQFIIHSPTLATLGAWATVALELGTIVVILLGRSYWPFALGLLAMHLLIAFGMRIFFFDQFVLFALFLPWDRIFGRLASDDPLVVAYDEHCYFCARSLYLVKQLDVNRVLEFYTQSDLPAEYAEREVTNLDEAMFVYSGDDSYRGYHGFKRILAHLGPLRALAWVMDLALVTRVGERVYAYVAANRNRYFVCSIESDN